MADGNSETDLFGDPIVEPQEGRGRPEHRWTLKNSNKVLLAFARGRTPKEVALAIGVSVPTLRKHYFSELEQRQAAHLRFEATQLHRLNEAAKSGNVAAEKELMKAMEKARLEQLRDRVATRGERSAAAPKMGKKEQRRAAANQVRGKFEPRPAPSLLVN